jgi:SAM-dependent methyltransferase
MFPLHFFPMPIPNSNTNKKNKSNISKASCESWSVVGGIRNQYRVNGDAKTYYEKNGEAYTNPHFSRLNEVLPGTLFDDIVVPKILVPIINAKKKTKNKGKDEDVENVVCRSEETTTTCFRVLDFCCGSGEFSHILLRWSKDVTQIAFAITAADPYTREAFKKQKEFSNVECKPWSFKSVCEGCLEELGDEDFAYDIVAISYAIHLLQPSLEHLFYNALAKRCRYLVIVSPTKNKGVIEKNKETKFGFKEIAYETKLKVHLRVFESLRRRVGGVR